MAEDMFRPPVNRSMLKLDRAFFKKTIPLKAARVLENQNISKVRSQLERSKDALCLERLQNVRIDPHTSSKKCILLAPRKEEPSPVLEQLEKEGLLEVFPYDLQLDYDYWTYHEIMSAIMPEDEQGDIPSGFTQTGHVAHFNLRAEYLKYKYLLGEILIDKAAGVTTVINKVDDVGSDNAFRTFSYEVLAGKDDLNVLVSHQNCMFAFDFSKVYWNSRLGTEHNRLVSQFKEGEAVCDVMAGIGPFAVPAGKKHIFVWANDLNPDSYAAMLEAVRRNKVQSWVKPFNMDGHKFIPYAARSLLRSNHFASIYTRNKERALVKQRELLQPKTFQHFVMNLPATAMSFLPAFIGLYAGCRDQLPEGTTMPLVHVYCFNTKSEDNAEEFDKICEDISGLLEHPMQLGEVDAGGVSIHDVRDVAPKKRMFCASFRLPEEVAFRAV